MYEVILSPEAQAFFAGADKPLAAKARALFFGAGARSTPTQQHQAAERRTRGLVTVSGWVIGV